MLRHCRQLLRVAWIGMAVRLSAAGVTSAPAAVEAGAGVFRYWGRVSSPVGPSLGNVRAQYSVSLSRRTDVGLGLQMVRWSLKGGERLSTWHLTQFNRAVVYERGHWSMQLRSGWGFILPVHTSSALAGELDLEFAISAEIALAWWARQWLVQLAAAGTRGTESGSLGYSGLEASVGYRL